MSTQQHPKQRSDRARIDYLIDELDRMERNLQSWYDESHKRDDQPYTFGEAHRWKLDAELDMIADIREMIRR